MQRSVVHIEVERGERSYVFECEPNSPLGEIYDVLCQMQHHILEKMQQAAQKPKESHDDSSV